MNAGNDPTAFFIRSLPDAVLVFRGKGRPAVLLEFKDARTEISDHVFVRARADHNQSHQGTRLRNKADIFPIGKASLDAYQQLANIGVKIVVVGWQSWRDVDAADLRVQYVEHIDTCYVWEQDHRPWRDTLANVHYAAFVPIQDFFEREFSIPRKATSAAVAAVRR